MSRTDHASRRIAATRQAVYAAMTDAKALEKWLPPSGMSGEMRSFDLRPGGHYEMVLRHDDEAIAGKSGGNQDIAKIRYLELVPDRLVSQAIDFPSEDPRFSGTMIMHWVLEDVPGGTLVSIRAEDVPEGIGAADHAEGLASSLGNLARLLER